MTDTKYIIDTAKPFRGVIQTVVNPDGFVAYTSPKMTEAEYLEKNPAYKVINESEFDSLMVKFLDELQTPFVEITEDRFDNMLNVLPPMRWTRITDGQFFFICEADYGNIHMLYVEYKGKFYSAPRPRTMKTEEIVKQIKNIS